MKPDKLKEFKVYLYRAAREPVRVMYMGRSDLGYNFRNLCRETGSFFDGRQEVLSETSVEYNITEIVTS